MDAQITSTDVRPDHQAGIVAGFFVRRDPWWPEPPVLAAMNILIGILSLVCLASAFITFGLGIEVFFKRPASALHRAFFLMMLCGTYWGIGEFMIWQVGTFEGAWFWLKASSFWPFTLAFTLLFSIMFTRPEQYARHRGLTIASIFIPAILISYFLLFTDLIYTIQPLSATSFAYLPVTGSIAYPLYAGSVFLMMLVVILVFFTYWRHASTRAITNQALLFCAGFSVIILCGSVSGLILPIFSIRTPNLVFIGMVIFAHIVTIAMKKHELFVLSPATAVPDILRTMPDGMVLSDMNGSIISTNESAGHVLGVKSSELAGKVVSSCVPEPVFLQIRSTLLEKGTVTDLETIPNNAVTRVVSIAGSLVSDPGGYPAGMVLIVRDITERKATENALRVAGRKISLLTQVTRHDINNMISALAGYLLLIRDNPADPGIDSYVQSSLAVVDKISNQLRFTREYQDIGSHQPLWLDLSESFSRALCDISRENVIIHSTISQVEIFSDPMIVKVFYNILENSLRHGKQVTRIDISAQPATGDTLQIIIEDDGAGITREEKERIFKYGYGKHTGLGLAVSRDILSLTGITISECGQPGAGARFEIVVPKGMWRPRG